MPSTAATSTLIGEIASTRDSQRSGAVDIEWAGARASIYFVFGQPSHATFTRSDGTTLEGSPALERLLSEIPDEAIVGAWRRVMIPEDTLRCSIDDLYRRCTQRLDPQGGAAGSAGFPAPPARPVVPFGVDDFPLLPLGTSLWSDAAANVVHLDMLAPKLPDSLIVLTAPGRRAAAVIARGTIVDAVWVDATTGLLGDDASRALMNTAAGTVSGYGLDDERLLAAIPILWRCPRPIVGLQAAWLDVDRMVAAMRENAQSCALLVEGAVSGAALFSEGELVASYTEQRRRPTSTVASLRALLRTPGARVTVVTDAETRTIDRRLGEGAFHVFIDQQASATGFAPGVVDERVGDVTDPGPPATGNGSRAIDSSSRVEVPTVDGDGNVSATGEPDDEAPPSHMPADVFSLPEIAPAAPPPPAPTSPDAAGAVASDPPNGHGTWEQSATDADSIAEHIPVVDEPTTVAWEEPAAVAWEEPAAVAWEEPPAADAPMDHAEAPFDDASPPVPTASSAAPGGHEFVRPRLEVDIDALRGELIAIATVWLGADDIVPIAELIRLARPGVDEFVGTIAAIGALQVPGHENAVVRAMTREMHFRAAEVLCGV